MSAADMRAIYGDGLTGLEAAIDEHWPDCSACGDTGWMQVPVGKRKVVPCVCAGLAEPPLVGENPCATLFFAGPPLPIDPALLIHKPKESDLIGPITEMPVKPLSLEEQAYARAMLEFTKRYYAWTCGDLDIEPIPPRREDFGL